MKKPQYSDRVAIGNTAWDNHFVIHICRQLATGYINYNKKFVISSYEQNKKAK